MDGTKGHAMDMNVLRAAERQAKIAHMDFIGNIRARCIEMNHAFEWTSERIRGFRELDEFLSEKQRLLYEKVREAEEAASELLSHDKNFLGGEFEIEGTLLIDEPGDGDTGLLGVDKTLFSIMAREASRAFCRFSCSSYHPLSQCEDFTALLEERHWFPSHGKPVMQVCDALYCLYDRHIFSCDDLLALDRGLFTCTVSISNAF